MTVKKVKGGYATVHCHGKNKGRTIHKFPTKAKAIGHYLIDNYKFLFPKKFRDLIDQILHLGQLIIIYFL